MAFDYTRFGGSLLSGLGSGLMAAGSEGGWNNFGGGFMQGQQAYDQNQFQQQDRQDRQQMRELQEQQLQMQLEAQRTANQDRVKQQQAIDQMIGGGFMAPNGMSQAQFGGAPIDPGMMSQNFNPQQIQAIRAMPLEMQTQILGQELFKDPAEYDPKVAGGMYLDPITREWAPIPGYQEQQERIRAAGKTSTTVNMGSTGIDYGEPETGLAWVRNPDGSVRLDERGAPMAVPYQGSKAFEEAKKVNESKTVANEQKAQTAGIVTEDIDRALALVDSATLPTTGFAGPFISQIGGTAANDVRALIDTVKANVGFDKLQAMRQSSPTGGALGSITERETALLQATLGNLEQSQTPQQFKDNLKRVKDIYLDIIHGPGNRPGAADTTSEFVRDPVTNKLVRKK